MDNRVKELRNEKGIRQQDLAGALNLSQQTISRIENGHNSLPADILIDLAKYFRVSVDYILKLSDSRMTQEYRIEAERNMAEKADFFHAYARLNRTNQELLTHLMTQLEEQQEKKR